LAVHAACSSCLQAAKEASLSRSLAWPVRQVKGMCGPMRGVGANDSAIKGLWSEHGAIAMTKMLPG